MNWAERAKHPLMRQPKECIHCRRWHMPDEKCRVTAYCVSCGRVAGIFGSDATQDRECLTCHRKRFR